MEVRSFIVLLRVLFLTFSLYILVGRAVQLSSFFQICNGYSFALVMAMSWLFKGSFWLVGAFSALQMPLTFQIDCFSKKKKKKKTTTTTTTFQIDLQMPLSSILMKITIIYKTSNISNYSIAELRSLSLWMLSNLITHLEWKVKIILIKGPRSLNMIWFSGKKKKFLIWQKKEQKNHTSISLNIFKTKTERKSN